jgi:hypothetical protein
MKIEELARPGVLALGVMGFAATALLGFAAGVAVARDPEVLRRAARRVARGLEGTALMAAQAREHLADLWAEAREEAIAEVDAADFERAVKRAPKAAAAASRKSPRKPPRKAPRQGAARPRKSRAAAAALKEDAADGVAPQA